MMATFLVRERRDRIAPSPPNIGVSQGCENPEFSVGIRPDVVGCRSAAE
jgi:hypothetical protein